MKHGNTFKDLTGRKFYRLTVLEFIKTVNGRTYWLCECECGNTKEVRTDGLTSGHSKSCGCLQKEIVAEIASENQSTHRMSKTRFYNIYNKMRARCEKEYEPAYRFYGAKGITVCERWRTFENFYTDMHASYLEHARKHGEENTTIERRNNEWGYTPENCTWATWEIQWSHRRIYRKAVE